jgi:hypothetical protein
MCNELSNVVSCRENVCLLAYTATVYGDAAVVTGRLQRNSKLNGQQVSDDWRFTKVYTRHAET